VPRRLAAVLLAKLYLLWVVIASAAPLILQSLTQAHPGLLAEALTVSVQGPAAMSIGRWLNVHTAWDPLGGPIRA